MLPTPTTRRWSISALLSGLLRPASTAASAWPVKLRSERLEPEPREPRVRLELARRAQIEHAEAARVDEPQPRAVVEAEGQMLVRAGRQAVEQQAAGHAEMEQEGPIIVEVRQDVLGPAPDPLHPPPDQALGQPFGQREAQVRPPLLERGDPPAGQTRGQRPDDGLDFRQLGHGPTIPAT